MPSYFERYCLGERDQVWSELYALGDEIQQEPLSSDVLAVTKETMTRVRENIIELIKRLNSLGYDFGVYPPGRIRVDGYKEPLNPPEPTIHNKILEYESTEGIGSIPLSLKVFWEVVGDVDLTGHHPRIPKFSDPLIVYPVETIEASYPEWRYATDEGDEEAGNFLIPLAPDCYHKDNVSGGAPYGIYVPNYAIDGVLVNERHQTTFVNYLRICFRYGGFPGLQVSKDPISSEVVALADGLLPI